MAEQRRIIAAIARSLKPVFNALVIVALIIAIYAILGVDFFRDKHVRFHNLTEAVFTMFQVRGTAPTSFRTTEFVHHADSSPFVLTGGDL